MVLATRHTINNRLERLVRPVKITPHTIVMQHQVQPVCARVRRQYPETTGDCRSKASTDVANVFQRRWIASTIKKKPGVKQTSG